MSDFQSANSSRPLGGPPDGPNGFGGGVRILFRQVLALIGLVLIIISVPLGFLTPFLPVGLPIGIFGAALLARSTVWGQRLIRHLVNRYPKLKQITPDWLMNLITGKDKSPQPDQGPQSD